MECEEEVCVEYEEKLEELRDAWAKYKNYLMEKYPAKEGETWGFSCEHHKAIDKILSI